MNARFPSNTNYSSFHVISMTKHQSHITDVCLLTTHQEDGGLKSYAPLWLFLFCHGKLSSSENPLSTVTKETIYWEYFPQQHLFLVCESEERTQSDVSIWILCILRLSSTQCDISDLNVMWSSPALTLTLSSSLYSLKRWINCNDWFRVQSWFWSLSRVWKGLKDYCEEEYFTNNADAFMSMSFLSIWVNIERRENGSEDIWQNLWGIRLDALCQWDKTEKWHWYTD